MTMLFKSLGCGHHSVISMVCGLHKLTFPFFTLVNKSPLYSLNRGVNLRENFIKGSSPLIALCCPILRGSIDSGIDALKNSIDQTSPFRTLCDAALRCLFDSVSNFFEHFFN